MENLDLALILNMLRGYNQPMSYELLTYALGLVRHNEFVESLRLQLDFDNTISLAFKIKSDMINEIDLEQLNNEINQVLPLGMILGYFALDKDTVTLINDQGVLDMNEAIHFGKLLQEKTIDDLKKVYEYEAREIIVLDGDTLGSDMSFDKFNQLGHVVYYPYTSKEETKERIQNARYVLTNKVILDKEMLEGTSVEYIGILATGTNNVDLDYCANHHITVKNVENYGPKSVAEHALALYFGISHHLCYLDHYCKSGDYYRSNTFTLLNPTFNTLENKRWGIVGLGNIGKAMYHMVSGMCKDVVYYSTSNRPQEEGYKQVSFDELLSTCDVISIHAPLNEKTHHLFDLKAFSKMKKNAILVNVGRGPIIKEEDLYYALNLKVIAGAALDVFEKEPLDENSKLLKLNNILCTPHYAWASFEARDNLMNIAFNHLKNYLEEEC